MIMIIMIIIIMIMIIMIMIMIMIIIGAECANARQPIVLDTFGTQGRPFPTVLRDLSGILSIWLQQFSEVAGMYLIMYYYAHLLRQEILVFILCSSNHLVG